MPAIALPYAKHVLLLSMFMSFAAPRAMATAPPEYVELTRAEMARLGFKFKLHRIEKTSWIELNFPKRLRARQFWLVPHLSTIVAKAATGEEIATTTNFVEGNEIGSVDASYNHLVSNLQVSVTYTCARRRKNRCYGASTYSISSVSALIDENADAVNLPAKCRQVSSNVFDCTGQVQPPAAADRPGLHLPSDH